MQQRHNSIFSRLAKLAVLLPFLAACQSLKSRDEVKQQPGRPAPIGTQTPPPPPDQPLPPGQVVVPPPPVDEEPAPPPQPTFLNKELPKIGVILGPGGMKTFAHVGVLREFARARLPIHAITGMEWGAMMAAFYAEKGLANDVDWKAFRMRESDLPSSGVLRDFKAKPISEFDSYLSLVFTGGSAERAKVPFGCPSITRRERLNFLNTGSLKEVVSRCVPFPPLIADSGESMAAADAVEESARWLRSQGANLIILVNVLGPGDVFTGRISDHYGTSVLWSETRRALLKARAPTVNWIVNVNTASQKIDDFAPRRATVDLGAKSATDLTQKLTKQYGF